MQPAAPAWHPKQDESEANMDNFWARQSPDATGSEPGSWNTIDDPVELPPDDPLGDEGAFPSTWQRLASGDAPRD